MFQGHHAAWQEFICIFLFVRTPSFSRESTEFLCISPPSELKSSSRALSGSVRVICGTVSWMWSTLQMTISPHESQIRVRKKSTDCYQTCVGWGGLALKKKRKTKITSFLWEDPGSCDKSTALVVHDDSDSVVFFFYFFNLRDTGFNLPLAAEASPPASTITASSPTATNNEFMPAVNIFSSMPVLLIQPPWLLCLHSLGCNDSMLRVCPPCIHPSIITDIEPLTSVKAFLSPCTVAAIVTHPPGLGSSVSGKPVLFAPSGFSCMFL